MRTILLLLGLLMYAPANAQDQLSDYQMASGKVMVGDPISMVQAKLGKPSYTYEIQNAFGGVIEFDYVWLFGGDELTFVVTVDGIIASIWQT